MLPIHPKDALQYTASRQRECREAVEQGRQSNPAPLRKPKVHLWSNESKLWGRFIQFTADYVARPIYSLKALYRG
jgi:hypothetical protein